MALGNNGLTTSITQPDVTLNVTVPVVNTNGTVTQGAVTSVAQPQVIVNISDSGILTTVPTGQVVATVEGVYQSVPTATQGFFNRVFDDLVSSTETSFWVEKVLFDNIQLSEQVKLVVAFIRGYSDQLNISDTIKLTTGKYYSDSVSASDAGYFKKTTIKSNLETILVTDTKNFSVSKTLTDFLQIVETKRSLIQKPVIDSIRITDLFATVSNYFKNFTELVSPTDDYYGLANIDDDEYATFNKVVNEWLQITQSAPIFQVAKALTETVLSVETVSKSAAKAITPDSASIRDYTVNQTVAAGSFIPGQTYVILSTGTTNYTLIGASSNQPGTQFVATDTGTGTGQAYQITPVFQVTGKPSFIDLLTISDQKYFSTSKQVLETLTLTERIQKAVSVVLRDIAANSESVNKYLTKLLSPETITLAEYFVYVLARFYEFSEQFIVSDTNSFSIGKNAVDLLSITDSSIIKAISFGRVYTETINTQDILSRLVNFNLTLADLVYSTDDYYGLANIDDDQYALFNKTATSEQVTTDDFSSYRILKIIPNITEDTALYSELINKRSLKYIADAINQAEYINKQIQKIVQDTVTQLDYHISTVNKSVLDNISIVIDNSFLIYPTKVLSDSIQLSEQTNKQVNKLVQEVLSNLDVKNISINKRINDTVTNTDVAVTNYIVAGPSKYLTDLLTVSSSVTINQQNYFASSYVTAGYTGSFTYAT